MKRRRFEDRLERELLAAARRQAEESGAVPQRGRLRIAVGAAAAMTALAAVTLAVVIGPPHDSRRVAPTAAAPRTTPPPVAGAGCTESAIRSDLELTTEALPRELADAYALLRRPQTAVDTSVCAVLPEHQATVRTNPAEQRYGGSGPGPYKLWVGSRWLADRPQLCLYVELTRYSGGSITCGDALPGVKDGFSYFTADDRRSGRYVFVVPDGVANVELRFDDGHTTRLPVRGNVAWHLQHDVFESPRTSVGDYALLDGSGNVLTVARAAR
ncbi:hypothetical protein VSS74_17175 [Conexibacter stalactiti]|uniref:Uncharacterized protein n=1 Tax=Conexibacter stalactiti TaxID=1940611 RepID=A0ABU4HRY4_9ACTN|nr:hypothetical protein [Conexibacter stalactiti]MDW5596082.1 hypothetical protein [Conexibacter stalactiti]MEC5036724.1 hypothetical protein [Conexibacter stalactiti]